MGKRQPLVDPEPFTIVVGVAGIVSGLASAVSLYRVTTRAAPGRSHRQVLHTLDRVGEVLDGIREDLRTIQRVAAEAVTLDAGPGILDGRILLVPMQFRDYARSAERLLGKLRVVLKVTHQLERRVPHIRYVEPYAERDVIEIRSAVRAFVRETDRSVVERLADLAVLIDRVEGLVEALRGQLRGPRG